MKNGGEPAGEETTPAADTELPRDVPSEANARRRRTSELLLIGAVAFLMPIVSSIRWFVVGPTASPIFPRFRAQIFLAQEGAALALLAYVLWRRNKKDFALDFQLRDVPHSLVLAVAGYFSYGVVYSVAYQLYTAAGGHVPVTPNWLAQISGSAIAMIIVCVNPFCEELIVRAFVITEVEALSGRLAKAILASVGIQTLYHLYQGVVAATAVAALSLVLSAYFARYRRITPVILVHLYFDFLALIWSVGR